MKSHNFSVKRSYLLNVVIKNNSSLSLSLHMQMFHFVLQLFYLFRHALSQLRLIFLLGKLKTILLGLQVLDLTFKVIFLLLNLPQAILNSKLCNLQFPFQVMRILQMLLFHRIHLFLKLCTFLSNYFFDLGVILVNLNVLVSLGAIRTGNIRL